MSYIPKYILKRMFPKGKSLKVVNKDGKKYVLLQMINVISPISIPESVSLDDLDFNPEDVGNLLKIEVNGKPMEVTLERIKNKVSIWHAGKEYTYQNIFFENAAGGLTIPVGGKLTILIEYEGDIADIITGPGEYEVHVEVKSDNPINVTVKTELKDFDVPFDPSDT
ncbi:MAG: hypothetical protein ACTSU2_14595 [Promethearchaeota archaeon]